MAIPSLPDTIFRRRAELPLEFLIVGAGLGGLACAYNLRQAGHAVRVLERADRVGKAHGGVRVPPNMTRLLERWGLGPQLKKLGMVCPRIVFHEGHTGVPMGELVFHEEVMRQLQANVILMLHCDLHRLLYDAAVACGVAVEFNAEVVAVDPSRPSARLANGTVYYADIVIGADGDSSVVRPLLLGEEGENETVGPYTSHVFHVTAEQMEGDEELLALAKDPSWNIWMSTDRATLIHGARGGQALSCNLFWDDDKTHVQKGWAKRVDLSTLNFSDLEPKLQRLMRIAGYAIQTQHTVQPPLETYFDELGHVVVIGEAAHPLNPGGSHNASMAVEDGTVLGSLFSRLRSRDQIPHLLTAFQELREARCTRTCASEVEKVRFVALPPGPQRDARDAHMSRARAAGALDWNASREKYLVEQWEEFRDLFGYDAYDEADTWWVEWGVVWDRSQGRARNDLGLGKEGLFAHVQTVEVTVEEP